MKNSLTCIVTNQNKAEPQLLKLIDRVNKNIYKFFNLKSAAYYELTFVISKNFMKKINFTYRKKNKVTDVISFCFWENSDLITPLLGEIFICLSQIKNQAKKYGVSWEYEFARMLTHSILHLFGFNHENNDFDDYYVNWIQTTLADKICSQTRKKK